MSCIYPASASDPACQNELATSVHAIAKNGYELLVRNFYSSPEPPKSYAASDILSLIDKVDPVTNHIGLTYDPTFLSNADINLNVSSGFYPTGDGLSIALILGVISAHNPVTFRFTKSKDATGRVSVIFETTSSGGTTDYFDYTTLYP